MHFLRNHQENRKKSASYQQITTKSTVNYKLLTVNYKLLFPGGPIPHNLARPLIGPPTLERSGSEHRRAVTSSLFGQERGLVRDVEPSLMVKKDGMILGKRHYLSLYIFS
mgnify:CR=1 FL=1